MQLAFPRPTVRENLSLSYLAPETNYCLGMRTTPPGQILVNIEPARHGLQYTLF